MCVELILIKADSFKLNFLLFFFTLWDVAKIPAAAAAIAANRGTTHPHKMFSQHEFNVFCF